MKFNWGRAFYLALKFSMYGAIMGFVLGLVVGIGRGKFETAPAFAIVLFWVFGVGRLGWEALSKEYPDA